MNYYSKMKDVSELLGKTLVSVTQVGRDEILFVTAEGETYKLYHEQDCCEYVEIEDVVGDLQDLVGSEILVAEEVTGTTPKGFRESDHESHTWTFYKFATIKGYVDIRWFGSSNGYYSESVNFCKE